MRPESPVGSIRLLTLILGLLLGSVANGQCSWIFAASPQGVYSDFGQPEVRVTTSWTPPGSSTPALVVGGGFQYAGVTTAGNIAYWDGSAWHTLGAGFNGHVDALAVLGGVLYAGGDFTSSGTTTLHYFAYWTGTAWQDAGSGTDGPVYALAPNGAELVVGGYFMHVNGSLLASRYIARYTPATWSTYPGTLMTAPVRSIAILNNQPIVICEETDYEQPPEFTETMYRWTGSQWSMVDRLLYAGGMGVMGGNLFYSSLLEPHDYMQTGTCQETHEYGIVQFDGTNKHLSNLYHSAASFVFYNEQLYAIGYVRYICQHAVQTDPTGDWMGTWTGTQWISISSLNPGINTGVLGTANGLMYVGGTFTYVDSFTQASNIACLVGLQWHPLAEGLDGPVTCSQPGGLTIGGSFLHEGSTGIPYEAAWNGQTWASTATFNGPLTSLTNYSANPLTLPALVASGSFTQIAGTAYNHIALHVPFAGSWTALGSGIDAPALATLAYITSVNHSDLYVGGQFNVAGGATVNHIARWTGGAWSALGSGTNGDVRALVNFNGLIVAGGSFTTAGGAPAGYIAAWNGSAWTPIGAGVNGAVRSLLVYNGQLIAGGDFTIAGGVAAPHLAAWNGSSWSAFNGGTDGTVNAMLLSSADLIIGGSFSHANGFAAANLADWNGSSWGGVSGGTDGPVLTLSLSNGSLLAGGTFQHAGGQYSPYAALAPTPGTPSVTQQPTDITTCPAGSATFTVDVDPGAWFVPVTYNWYHDGTLMNDGINPSGSRYSQCHTDAVTIDNASAFDAGGYWCVATTACGQIVSSATAQWTVGGSNCCGSADFNCDGDLGTDADIESFFACLAGNCPGAPCPSTADFNADGDLGTDADIEAFFRVLGGGSC